MHVHEVQRALRRLFSSPGTLVLSVTMLASAIGITTAMFTVVDALVLRPLPFHDPTSLTALAMGVKGGRGYMTTSSQAVLRAWKGSGAFEAVEAVIEEDAVIEHGGELVKKRAARITPQLLAMLGVEPLRGRSFVPGEGRTGTTDRILLSADLWHSLFNRDPQIIGRRIRVSGTLMEVVGILPAGFRFPSSTTVLWIPADFDAPPKDLEKAGVMVYARLKDRMPRQDILETADRAGRDSGALSDRLQTMLRPIAAGMVDPYATRAITALSIAVALVFAVLCLNGTNLMLTRFSLRQREFGVCSALGASRARLLREALIETAFLAMIAGIAGVLLANGLVALATRLLPEVFLSKTLTPIAISTRAVAATFVLTLVAAGIAGITPAWIATRVDPADSFRAVVRGTEARPRRRLSRALLVGEVALATTLLTGAALLVRTFVNLANAERGLNGDGVITGLVNLPAFAFKERPSRLAFAAALEDRLRQLPGVSHVSLSGGVPPGVAAFYFGDIRTLGEDPRTVSFSELNMYNVSPEFFDLFQIRMQAGRTFAEPSDPNDIIVGERFARMLWPDGRAVGRTFAFENGKTPLRVIAVVDEIRTPSRDPRLDRPEIYFPLVVERGGQTEASALASGNIYLALRCAPACPELPAIRQAVRDVSAQVVIASLGPMDEAYVRELARPRASAALATTFALVALLACAVGVFSVLAAAVAARRREFGIRVALGIEPSRLRGVIMFDAARLGILGLAAGSFGGWALGRSLSALTYEVQPGDLQSWVTVCGSLALALLAGAWRPASQAARLDPVRLLREE